MCSTGVSAMEVRQIQCTRFLKLLKNYSNCITTKKWWSSYLLGTSMFIMQVSRSSPYRSVHVARSQRWS